VCVCVGGGEGFPDPAPHLAPHIHKAFFTDGAGNPPTPPNTPTITPMTKQKGRNKEKGTLSYRIYVN